mgnify:FL=1
MNRLSVFNEVPLLAAMAVFGQVDDQKIAQRLGAGLIHILWRRMCRLKLYLRITSHFFDNKE